MKKTIALLLSLLLCIGLLTACGAEQAASANTRTITDGAGRTVEVPETVESIVCVGVGALRYTCYMDAEDLVIAVEDCEIEPVISRLYNYVNIQRIHKKSIKTSWYCLFNS